MKINDKLWSSRCSYSSDANRMLTGAYAELLLPAAVGWSHANVVPWLAHQFHKFKFRSQIVWDGPDVDQPFRTDFNRLLTLVVEISLHRHTVNYITDFYRAIKLYMEQIGCPTPVKLDVMDRLASGLEFRSTETAARTVALAMAYEYERVIRSYKNNFTMDSADCAMDAVYSLLDYPEQYPMSPVPQSLYTRCFENELYITVPISKLIQPHQQFPRRFTALSLPPHTFRLDHHLATVPAGHFSNNFLLNDRTTFALLLSSPDTGVHESHFLMHAIATIEFTAHNLGIHGWGILSWPDVCTEFRIAYYQFRRRVPGFLSMSNPFGCCRYNNNNIKAPQWPSQYIPGADVVDTMLPLLHELPEEAYYILDQVTPQTNLHTDHAFYDAVMKLIQLPSYNGAREKLGSIHHWFDAVRAVYTVTDRLDSLEVVDERYPDIPKRRRIYHAGQILINPDRAVYPPNYYVWTLVGGTSGNPNTIRMIKIARLSFDAALHSTDVVINRLANPTLPDNFCVTKQQEITGLSPFEWYDQLSFRFYNAKDHYNPLYITEAGEGMQ